MSCITLLSDFGLIDASVASAKGILMQYTPHIPIIDISHSIEPFHGQQAAYILASAYKNFPEGSVHIILFDVFSEKEPRLLLCENEGHYFLAPDNGILSLAFNNKPDNVWSCMELTKQNVFKDWLHQAASIIKQLQTSSAASLQLKSCELKNAPVHWLPKVNGNVVECHVIHIDRFENVVINITQTQFEEVQKGRPFRIQFMRDEEINTLRKHYSDEREGEKLCRFNATGYLEIAINRGKAASLFGLRLHQKQHVMYNTIKIFFE
ncbi:MAG TPA: SAM-dependent chlorinase/fluorinase [Flavipsychrobacter sp.]|nr:SAM-dependent chlorinase/fluorinase [Flavipsychrobacter sp.]